MSKVNGNQKNSAEEKPISAAEAVARAEAAEAAEVTATARAETAEAAEVTATARAEDAEANLSMAESIIDALEDDAGDPSLKEMRGEEIDFLADDYDGPMTGEIAEARHKHKSEKAAAESANE